MTMLYRSPQDGGWREVELVFPVDIPPGLSIVRDVHRGTYCFADNDSLRPVLRRCPSCNGEGRFQTSEVGPDGLPEVLPCRRCKGGGYVDRDATPAPNPWGDES